MIKKQYNNILSYSILSHSMSNMIDETVLFRSSNANDIAILLVDASGSVSTKYDDTMTIFNKMKAVIKGLPHKQFRIIFWNSDNERENNKFPSGVSIYPYLVDKVSIDSMFTLFATYITNECVTLTYLGVDALVDKSSSWLNQMINDVYIITDGQMGYSCITQSEKRELGIRLATSIKKLINTHNCNLYIYTVEAVRYNFDSESLQSFAGSDVYKVIQENQLTKSITKFVTFDLTNSEKGYTHISRTNAIKGFIPYKDRLFSESKITMFLQWIKQTVDNICKESTDSTKASDQLLKIVQDLTPTLSALTSDKPCYVSDQIINNFCNIFRSTPLDFYLAKFILDDSIKNERAGQAQLLSVYQQKRRDFFKLANDLLAQSTSKYIGILNYFVSYPLGDYIITGHSSLINASIQKFTNSAVDYQNYIFPVMPLDFKIGSDINGQCLRQWTRATISKLYNVDMFGDIIIYIVMMINMRVQLVDLPESIKSAYTNLCTTMLSKKRLNSESTELDRLLSGSFPTPNNGRVEDFYKFMATVLEKSGLEMKIKPMTMWFALVLAYGNSTLIVSQLQHCLEDIKADYPQCEPLDLLTVFAFKPFVLVEMAPHIDYTCMISLDDCSKCGGYQFAGHTSVSGYHCQPVNIISADSFAQLFNNSDTVPCPICYTDIDAQSFIQIGPSSSSNAELANIPSSTPNIFSSRPQYKSTPSTSSFVSNNKQPAATVTPTISTSNYLSGPSAGEKKIWIQMVGTVGSGKTTLAKALKKAITEIGGHCIIVGVDKYLKKGMDFGSALAACRAALLNLANQSNPLTVAIIDTCGETKFNLKDSVFEIQLKGWKKLRAEPNYNGRSNLNGYLHWSLRNVLSRTRDSGCYLNPDVVGIGKCIDIHLTKAKGIFGKGTKGILFGNYNSAAEACSKLDMVADEYEVTVSPISAQVDKLMALL